MLKKGTLIIFILLSLFFTQHLFADDKSDLEKKIGEYESKLSELKQQKNSLASQISYMNTQMYLTELKIQETETKVTNTQKEITILDSRIDGLDSSLDYLSKLMLAQVVNGYKKHSVSIFDFLLDSSNANELLGRLKYYKTAQENNQKILIQVQEAKQNFEEQKVAREDKKIELAKLEESLNSQKADLDVQKAAKTSLLAVTQNDEAKYQQLLSQARAEYAAIQGIIAGAGTETKLRDVSKGQTIASVIPGASCNSSGSHLHFTVLEGSSTINPFSKLKDVDHIDYTGGDPWNPSGDWDWPLSPRIEFNQGYGVTNCVSSGICGHIYSFHNGLDIDGSSSSVYAVADGTLYRGSYSVGCTLPYTKVIHKDSNIVTLYLHTYTQ